MVAALLTQSALALLASSVARPSTCPSRLVHVRMQDSENFRDVVTNAMTPISATAAPPDENEPRAAVRATRARKRPRDVFAATSVFADDSVVPAPWVSERAPAPVYGTGGLMLPKGQKRSSPEQRGDAAQRDAERRARTEQEASATQPTDPFNWAKDDIGQTDLASGSDMKPAKTRRKKGKQAKATKPSSNASVDERARELAKEAIEAYFADEIDEAELNQRKQLARRQAEAELERGQLGASSAEQAQAALLKKAYVDSVKQNYVAATAARVAAEEALATALRVEEEAKQRVEDALRA